MTPQNDDRYRQVVVSSVFNHLIIIMVLSSLTSELPHSRFSFFSSTKFLL